MKLLKKKKHCWVWESNRRPSGSAVCSVPKSYFRNYSLNPYLHSVDLIPHNAYFASGWLRTLHAFLQFNCQDALKTIKYQIEWRTWTYELWHHWHCWYWSYNWPSSARWALPSERDPVLEWGSFCLCLTLRYLPLVELFQFLHPVEDIKAWSNKKYVASICRPQSTTLNSIVGGVIE